MCVSPRFRPGRKVGRIAGKGRVRGFPLEPTLLRGIHFSQGTPAPVEIDEKCRNCWTQSLGVHRPATWPDARRGDAERNRKAG